MRPRAARQLGGLTLRRSSLAQCGCKLDRKAYTETDRGKSKDELACAHGEPHLHWAR